MSDRAGAVNIVGGGRIGRMLADLAEAQGVSAALLGRGVSRPEHQGPVVVCTRNDDLDDVVSAVPAARHADLVFVQNGMIRPWLAERGLLQCTQGVLCVAVRWVGDPPVVGAPSVFFGRWAESMVGLLTRGGIEARVARDEQDYLAEVGVKLAWICALGPLSGATGLTVGEVCDQHPDALASICREICSVLGTEPGISLDAGWLVERVVDYTRSIPHFRSGVKEWKWRNGWLVDAAARHGLALPVHDAWVARAR